MRPPIYRKRVPPASKPLGTLLSAAFSAAALLAASSPDCLAQDISMTSRYRQSAEVLARYPSLKLHIDTPGLQAGRTTPTTQEELEAVLASLDQPHAPVVRKTIARTELGRNLPLLVFSREKLSDPAALRATGRPIVWLIGQQHGNEPAGAEAMLAIARELAGGRLTPLLDHLIIAMVPRANPDGAAADTRDNALLADLNRDHASLHQLETRAIHAAVQLLPPDLVIDAHEFSVASRWIEKFGGLQAVDLMVLEATHPAVPQRLKHLSRELFAPAIERAAKAHGLTTFDYHTTSTRKADRSIAMGGYAPGIARNAFGLMGAVSYLLETRGVGVGLEAFQRRVATHVVAVEAILTAAAANAEPLKASVAAARRDIAESPERIVLAVATSQETVTLPLVDHLSGAPRSVDVVMANSRNAQVLHHRLPPAAYIILPEAKAVKAELSLFGLKICHVAEAQDIDAEMFEIADRAAPDRRAINPDAAVKATLRQVRVHIPAGSLYIPLAQTMARRATAALEPDAPGSFVALDVIKVPLERTTAPIVRVPRLGALVLAAPDATPEAAAFCSRAGERQG